MRALTQLFVTLILVAFLLFCVGAAFRFGYAVGSDDTRCRDGGRSITS